VQRIAYRCGVVPIAVAEEVAKSVVILYGLNCCGVIPNRVPTLLYSHPKISRAEWRAANGFSQEEILFVCVARLTRQKNHGLLLRAFAKAGVAEHRARLVLAGTGLLGPELNREAARLGVADRVHFMGSRTDIPELLGAMDAFVLSSDWEGNPLSILEAMSAGLPVISTAVGGVPELFEDGVEGVMVQPGDALRFSQAIRLLCQEDETRWAMGAAASARAQTKFDVAEMVRAYEEVYTMRAAVPAGALVKPKPHIGCAALPAP
jgi:glycosyltransferase involved in cell wall biosynthesis